MVLTLFLAFTSLDLAAQQSDKASIRADYKHLNSLKESMADARKNPPPDGFLAIPNKPWRPIGGDFKLDDPEVVSKGSAALQNFVANGPLTPGVSFQALHHQDNWTPADPSGDVGPNHIVLAVNSNITVFNKNGSVAPGGGTTRADAIWSGTSCYGGSNGDPIILYDEISDRWIAAITHFSLNLLCVAASATSDPLGAWHDYVFDFGNQLPDYPKLGLTPDHLVVTAHMFGGTFNGTLFGTINKAAMYAGLPIDLLYASGYSYGYLPVDMDGPMASRNPLFVGFASSSTAYVYEMQNINYATKSLNVQFVNSIGFASVDRSVCSATRGQCIVQPATWKVESLDGRLMNRAQLRKYGAYSAIVFSQTINAGSERAGIAWYEIRSSGGNWSKWQEGQYAPNDGKHRWMPSIALNAAGDIGMSFMFSSPTHFPSVAVVGQSATERASATGLFDGNELVCTSGTSALDQNYKRSGDYAATVVDPVSDTFWGMQQYGFPGNWANWGIWICEFSVTPNSNTNPPTAAFSGTPLSGTAPFDVTFTDQSTDSPTSWSWDFGDGGTSTQRNPVHSYTVPGNHTVSLTATNGYGSDDEVKTDYVSVTAPTPPVANFSATPISGDAPLNVTFTDASTNSPTSWSWDFGDSGTSTQQNPSHTFTAAGLYTVSLTATNAGGSDDEVKINYISVTVSTPPVADFSADKTSGIAPLIVTFTDASTNSPTSWSWDFGDTGTSTGQNPSHSYTAPGDYTVSLTATNADGSDAEVKTDYISVQGATTKFFAQSEITADGSGSGSYTDTYANDNTFEVLTEGETGGKPANRTSLLDHRWTFNLTSGLSTLFYVSAYRDDNSENDNFVFEFSTDNSSFSPLVTVNSSVETPYQVVLASSPNGTVYVRVKDTGRGRGQRSKDNVYVDYMYFETQNGAIPPIAAFSATPTSGGAPLLVQFSDQSSGTPTSWAWTFGDGGTSSVQNPSHNYTANGNYDVTLTVTNAQGSDGETKVGYVSVSALPVVHVANITVSRSSTGKWVQGTADVLIHDGSGTPVGGVTITGQFSHPNAAAFSAATSGSGSASFQSDRTKTPPSNWCFEVTGVVLSGSVYDSGSNVYTTRCEDGSGSEAVTAKVLSQQEVPAELALDQNYPNPFNPVTIIQYGLPEMGRVTVSVYNALGVEVARLEDGTKEAGWHRAAFDGTQLSSGMYVAVIRFAGQIKTRTMLLAK